MSTIDRRAIITGAAAAVSSASVGALPLGAAEPDPAFAAIEAHRLAWEHLESRSCFTDEVERDDPRWIEVERDKRAAHDRVSAVEDAFVLTQPTAVAGVAAMLRYMGEHNVETGGDIIDRNSEFKNADGDVFAFSSALYFTLAGSLERIAAGRAIEPGWLTKCEDEDDNDEGEEEIAQEPRREHTPEEWADTYRGLIDCFTTKLAEIEGQIAAA